MSRRGQPDAIEALRALVTALDSTYWSSWQSTAKFWQEYEQAKATLAAIDAAKEQA